MKKEYIKPAVQVVMLKQRYCLLAGSPGAQDTNNSEGLSWDVLDEDDV